MPSQRFEKGNKIGKLGGRPKIDTAIKKMKAQANAMAAANLEGILGMAQKVIENALVDGDRQVAMWTIDRVLGKQASILPESVDVKLNTIDDVMHAAQIIVEMAMVRKMSIDDADKTLKMLAQFAAFRGMERLEEIKQMIHELDSANAKTIDGQAMLPSWGRLSENTKTANTEPAE
jgi:hypothetical protein